MNILKHMNTVINIRTEKAVRDEAKKVFSKMGMTTSAGINMFLNQVVLEKGMPFKPTSNTQKIKEKWDAAAADAIKFGKRYATAEEALADL